MKQGDKVLCKRSMKNAFTLENGDYYKILDNEGDCVVIDMKDNKYGKTRRFYFRDHEYNQNLPDEWYWFDDYFISTKQLRKKKLKEIFLKNES